MISLLRMNLVDPEGTSERWAERYQAMLDMAAYADENGMFGIQFEEHHGTANGWSPAPLTTAAMVVGRTEKLSITISALLLPLHDPITIAEQLAVLDLASGGRVITIVGLGYRPSEYTLLGREWKRRGRIMDKCIETMQKAWTGEPFEYNGEQVNIRPTPITKPHPTLMIGGQSEFAARRAARFGLPLFPSANLPELEAYYYEQCAEFGTSGFCMMPSADTAMVFLSEDPDRLWAERGHHFLHEAQTYAGWQMEGQKSAVKSAASTVDELRAEGIYKVLTPAECVERSKAQGAAASVVLHPLCGGMPVEDGWTCVKLFAEEVLPALA